jgi:hypothetical protein
VELRIPLRPVNRDPDADMVASDGDDAGLFKQILCGKWKSWVVDFFRQRRTMNDGPRSSVVTAVVRRLG